MPWHREAVLVKVVFQVMAAKPTTGAKPGRNPPKPPKWVLHELWLEQHGQEYRAALLRNIKEHLPGLEALRVEAEAQWPRGRVHPFETQYFEVSEIYRRLQPMTLRISNALQELLPERPIRKHFCSIIAEATSQPFNSSDPANMAKESKAILNPFFIAYYYLKMACDAGRASGLAGNKTGAKTSVLAPVTIKPPAGRPPNWWTALLNLFELQ